LEISRWEKSNYDIWLEEIIEENKCKTQYSLGLCFRREGRSKEESNGDQSEEAKKIMQ
jgi:hypothetical protein